MNPTIVRLAVQALLGRRRFWVLLAAPVALLALTALVAALARGDGSAMLAVAQLGYPLVLPLVALLAASSVLGPEIDDGSVVYLLAKPVNRHAVATSKWLVAWGATLLVGSTSVFLASVIAGGREQALGWWVAALVAGTAYSALFLALSATTRHAVVIGLVFVLVWERALGGLLDGVAWLSIGQWGIRVGHAVSGLLPAPASLPWALLASALATVGLVWFAGDRLRSFTLKGED